MFQIGGGGTVSYEAKIQDLLPSGYSMPVVLRPPRRQDDGYELLGCVYLDGSVMPDLRPVLRSSGSEMELTARTSPGYLQTI